MRVGVAPREKEKEWLVVKDMINPKMFGNEEATGERYEKKNDDVGAVESTRAHNCGRNVGITELLALSKTRKRLHSYIDLPEHLGCPASARDRQHPSG